MVDSFVALTRIDADSPGATVLVNLGQVAWIESAPDGTSRIVFALVRRSDRANDVPLTLLVREKVPEIALLAGVVPKTDREAIAQAWADQRGRRGISADER